MIGSGVEKGDDARRKALGILSIKTIRRLTWLAGILVVFVAVMLFATALQIANSFDAHARQTEQARFLNAVAIYGGAAELDTNEILSLAVLLGLSGGSLTRDAVPDESRASIALEDGRTFTWSPERPGEAIFIQYAPIRIPAGVLSALMLFGIIAALNRATGILERERKSAERLAHLDPLTGLANRLAFELVLSNSSVDTTQPIALLCLDLDGFKTINDSFGHAAGDAVLVELAARLLSIFSDAQITARLGGDEFCVLLPGASDAQLTERARNALIVLRQPYAIAGRRVEVGVSIGIAARPNHGHTAAGLQSLADAALYRAKSGRLGVCLAGTISPPAPGKAIAA
jgi:diguanylate cyclase (GGDEF)-like protein